MPFPRRLSLSCIPAAIQKLQGKLGLISENQHLTLIVPSHATLEIIPLCKLNKKGKGHVKL